VPEDRFHVRQPALRPGSTLERRYVDLVDQIAEKRRLGQDFHFQER
jgi:hypothetical protein